ncbi:MAG TPA: hypothetical protein DCX06_09765 [Opitutae bacterium]|nr:hypothetical protein [Opitutae bacterium]
MVQYRFINPNIHSYMNKLSILFSSLTALALSATAQTAWDGGGANTNIDDVNNWDNGLPSSTNAGTIGTGFTARVVGGTTYTGYHFTLGSGADITGTGVSQAILDGGEFTIDGGSVAALRGINLSGGQLVTVDNGSWDLRDRNTSMTGAGTAVVMNGGTVTSSNNRRFVLALGTTFTINAGTLGTGGTFAGFDGTIGDGGTVNFLGGVSNFTEFGYTQNAGPNGIVYNFGGTSGSVTAAGFDANTNGQLNWLAGAGISLTISGSTTWAEAEYNAGRLTYLGDDSTDLGLTWAQATSGGTQIWDFTGDTLTLAVPEPSSYALLAGCFGLAWVMLRRRKA